MMPDIEKLANSLFGGKRAETDSAFTLSDTHTMIGTATTDSDSGAVMVELSSDVTNPEPVEIDGVEYFADADTAVELPTTQDVQAGDEVLVSVFGGNALRSGVVTGVVGSGDRVAGMATEALDVANATGQHFWSDTDGAHVTELERSDWESQQTGANSLWNSLGMLFRDGLNNLLALITGTIKTATFTAEYSQFEFVLPDVASSVSAVSCAGVPVQVFSFDTNDGGTSSVYIGGTTTQRGDEVKITYRESPAFSIFDGEGNSAANVIASFTAGCIELGKSAASSVIRMFDGAGIIRADAYGFSIEGASGVALKVKPEDDVLAGVQSYVSGTFSHVLFQAMSADATAERLSVDFVSDSTGNTVELITGSTSATVTIEQAIISLTRPMATWTGASGTVTDGAGWHQMDFSVLLAEHGPWSEYFTQTGGRITALKDVTLQLTMDLSWNDNIMGIRGAGFFKNSAVGSGVNEISSFSAKGANNRFYCVFPPRLITLSAGEYLNIGRYNQLANSIFTRGTNYTWLTVEVVG